MGMEEEVQCQYLQRVEVHADLKKNTNNLKTGKKRTILKEVFMKKKPHNVPHGKKRKRLTNHMFTR